MSRNIDANALAHKVVINSDADFINKVTRLMIDAPSIDIVRCGECKYRKNRIDYERDYCIEHSKVIYNTDGYCSWAERSSE